MEKNISNLTKIYKSILLILIIFNKQNEKLIYTLTYFRI